MARHEWATLISLWHREKLDMEQMVGQLIQWGQHTHEQATTNQTKYAALERQVAALVRRIEALEQQLSQE